MFVWLNFLINKNWNYNIFLAVYLKKIKNLQICKFAEVLSLHKNLEFKLQKILGPQIANPHLRKVRKFKKFCKPSNLRICGTYLWTALLCKFATSVVDTSANLPQV
jgi:hypothetical protein